MPEYPPIIIDGSEACRSAADGNLEPAALSMRPDTGSAPAARLDPAASGSLLLIRNNLLHHEGDFRLDDIELLCGDDAIATSGKKQACLRLSDAPVTDHGSGLRRVGGRDKVRSIRIKGQQELLHYGQDFHNFLFILNQRD
jgi:hypothetical protein